MRRGLDKSGIKLIGPGDITDDELLPNLGDAMLGTITAHFYSAARNALPVEAVKRFPGLLHRETANRLRSRLLLYRQGRRRRSRVDLACPHPTERLEATLWQLLRVADQVPSERLIRAVVTCCRAREQKAKRRAGPAFQLKPHFTSLPSHCALERTRVSCCLT
jgi:hypothetical protein